MSDVRRFPQPALSIILVNYNTHELLQRSLAALPGALGPVPYEVIVVDNGSRTSPASLLPEDPRIRLLELPRNVGFGAGNNRGADLASGEVLLLLNTDAFLGERSGVAEILDYLAARPGVGALLPLLRDEAGRVQPGQVAYDPSLPRLLLDKPVKVLRRIPLLRGLTRGWAGRINLDFADLSRSRAVDVAVAAALFVKRDAYRSIGGFDEDFFMFLEDSDLCRRLRRAGYQVVFHPEWQVVHLWGRSISRQAERKRLYYQGQRLYFAKHAGPVERLLVRLLQAPYAAVGRLLRRLISGAAGPGATG